MKVRSLRLRLLAGAVAFLFLALGAAAAGLTFLFERHVKTWIDAELTANVDLIIASIDRAPDGRISLVRPPPDPRFSTPFSGYYWQVQTGDSNVTIRSPSLWDFALTLTQLPTIEDHAHHHRVAGPQGQTLYLLEKWVELPARLGRDTAHVAVGIDEAKVDAAVWQFAKALSPFLLLLGTLLSVATYVQVSLGLKPLARLRERTLQIRQGGARRMGSEYPEEIVPLTREIDTLLEARDREIDKAKDRAADLAHGLNTPIQVLIGGIGRLRAQGDTGLANDLDAALTTMQRHVQRQLAKARMALRQGDERAAIAPVLERVVNVVRQSADGARLDWALDIPPDLIARIHADDLAEALGGLLENAARHARTRVAVSAAREGASAVIAIGDDGAGIAEAHYEDALKRGRRLDTSRNGSGLGLAIVADIAEAAGGSIGFRKTDGLFTAVLTLPVT